MAVKNAYPNLPEIGYQKTTVSSDDVAAYISSLAKSDEIKTAAYVLFGNESAYGKKGVNNNYAGIQADGSKIGNGFDNRVVATCVLTDNAGNVRRFCCFDDWKVSIDYLVNRVEGRGLYIGGYAHPYAKMNIGSINDLATAYWREWVMGSATASIPLAESASFIAQYTSAKAKLYLAVPEQKKKLR